MVHGYDTQAVYASTAYRNEWTWSAKRCHRSLFFLQVTSCLIGPPRCKYRLISITKSLHVYITAEFRGVVCTTCKSRNVTSSSERGTEYKDNIFPTFISIPVSQPSQRMAVGLSTNRQGHFWILFRSHPPFCSLAVRLPLSSFPVRPVACTYTTKYFVACLGVGAAANYISSHTYTWLSMEYLQEPLRSKVQL